MITPLLKSATMYSITLLIFFPLFSYSESLGQNTANSFDVEKDMDEIRPLCELTLPELQGPYYKEGSPIKTGSFFEGKGEKLILSGKVLNFIDCSPISGAILDFWQADSDGKYDNLGFDLRGKIVSDENGNYKLDTIMPGSYSAGNFTRPAHIHVKAWIPENPGNPALVTQLYFENDPHKDIFVKDPLILKTTEKNGTKFANFDFVLEDYRNFGK